MSDDEAREASLIANLQILRQEMDPITRARRVDIIDYNMDRSIATNYRTFSWTRFLQNPNIVVYYKERIK